MVPDLRLVPATYTVLVAPVKVDLVVNLASLVGEITPRKTRTKTSPKTVDVNFQP
jgi:hypothetical protein